MAKEAALWCALLIGAVWGPTCMVTAQSTLEIKVNGIVVPTDSFKIYVQPDQLVEFTCTGSPSNLNMSSTVDDERTTHTNSSYTRNVSLSDGEFLIHDISRSGCGVHLPNYAVLVYLVTLTPSRANVSLADYGDDKTETIRCEFITGIQTAEEQTNFWTNTTLWKGSTVLESTGRVPPEGTRAVEQVRSARTLGGEYRCTVQDVDGNGMVVAELANITQTITTTSLVELSFNPKEHQYVDGQNVNIVCNVFGFPLAVPSMSGPICSPNCELDTVDGSPYQYRISLTNIQHDQHRGTWTCSAFNGLGEPSAASHILRVRDNLAPLWPFIGIVVELIATGLFIYIGEKVVAYRKSQKALTAASD